MTKCFDCGKPALIVHKHHWLGKKRHPDKFVELCPNCHARHHQGLLLVRNKASNRFSSWLEQEEQIRYVPWAEMQAKLGELGYVPYFDGWETLPNADALKEQIQDWPGLPVYLAQVGAIQ